MVYCRLAYAQLSQEPDPQWFACTSDPQCIIVSGECGWAAVNKDFTAEAEEYFASLRPHVECADGGYAEPKPAAVCENHRCAIEQKESAVPSACGIENCHGADITCGPNFPDVCTAMYALGDFCRQYARCEITEGECLLVKSAEFDTCVGCIRECTDNLQNDPVEAFNCEAECRQKVQEKQP